MISRALDSNNDLLLVDGSIATVRNGAEVLQHVRTRLLFYQEEWFLDSSAGFPWFQEVFKRPARPGNVEALVKRSILETPGVDEILTFSLNFDRVTRNVSIQFQARTTYGDIIRDEVYLNV